MVVHSSLKYKLFRWLRIILDLLASLVGLRYPTQQKYLPPITNRILLEPAIEIAKQIKTGKLKSEQVVRVYIERIKSVQPQLNAVVQNRFEEALKEAREVDTRIQHEISTGQPSVGFPSIHSFPFLGVPFTVKDSVSVAGMLLTSGVYARKDVVAKEDASSVAELKKAGGIALAMTNVPELCMWWDSVNTIYGRCNNPYDKSRICGGSSGGEAALISACGSVFGVGADIGGSIRMPCYFCGIFGHKTTPTVVGTQGHYPMATNLREKLLSAGPMCRYACDLRPMLKVMMGENNKDMKKIKLDEQIDVSKLKIYYMEGSDNPLLSPVEPDILDAMHRVVAYFKSQGNECKKVNLSNVRHGFDIWMTSMHDESAPKMTEELTNRNGKINASVEIFKWFFGASKHTFCALVTCFTELISPAKDKKKMEKFCQMRSDLTKELHTLLGSDGVLLFPTHPQVAPKHNQTLLKFVNVSYTALFNALFVAITQVPLGLSKKGLPIGLQVIASPYHDNVSISVAEQLEKEFGGWVCGSKVEC